jgi:peptidoglycan/LPS O-acetylase OafA/YrhL
MKKHLDHFESLRGLAALWVAISHVLLICELEVPVLSKGGWAVDIFVILSGFVIGLMRLSNNESYFPYIIRRFGRIYPLYVAALILGIFTSQYYPVVIGASYWGGLVSPEFLVRYKNEQEHYLSHLLLHITMLHGAVPDTVLPQASLAFSGPLWSISLEWQFYLLAPWLVWALNIEQKKVWVWSGVVAAGSVLAYWWAKNHWQGEVPSFLPLRLPFFVFGVLSAVLWRRLGTNKWLTFVYLVVAVLILPKFGASRLAMLLWAVVFFCALFEMRGLTYINRALRSSPLKWLGQRSYGIYLLHMPLLLAVANLLGEYFADLGKIGALVFLLVFVLVVVLPLASLVYRYFEMPLNDYFRRAAARISVSAKK